MDFTFLSSCVTYSPCLICISSVPSFCPPTSSLCLKVPPRPPAQLLTVHLFIKPVTAVQLHTVYKYATMYGPSICLPIGHTNTQRSFALLATPLCPIVGTWRNLWRSGPFRLLATACPGCRSLSGLAQQMTQLTSLLIPSDFQCSVRKDRPYIFPIGKATLSFIAFYSWFPWRPAGSRTFMLCSQHC